MKILYFSWIKDQIGKAEESLDIKDNIQTIVELVNFLKNINYNYQQLLFTIIIILINYYDYNLQALMAALQLTTSSISNRCTISCNS